MHDSVLWAETPFLSTGKMLHKNYTCMPLVSKDIIGEDAKLCLKRRDLESTVTFALEGNQSISSTTNKTKAKAWFQMRDRKEYLMVPWRVLAVLRGEPAFGEGVRKEAGSCWNLCTSWSAQLLSSRGT